jgi:hypothetical protein
MKRLIELMLMLFLTFSTAISQPNFAKGHIGLGGAITLSPWSLTENWQNGLNLNGGFSLYIRPNFALVTNLDYYRFSVDKSKDFYTWPITSGSPISILTVTANLKATLYRQPAAFSPYILAGGGLMSISTHQYKFNYDGDEYTIKYEDEFVPVIDFGMGFDFLSKRGKGFFIETRYVEGLTEGESTKFIPLRVGIIF